MFSANRLQYASTSAKLQVSQQLFDRGILSQDDVCDIWQLPHIPGGDRRFIRGEYRENMKDAQPSTHDVPQKPLVPSDVPDAPDDLTGGNIEDYKTNTDNRT